MTEQVGELTHRGSVTPLSTAPVVGTPGRTYAPTLVPGSEPLAGGEIRVTILGSGDPWVRRRQASGSLLVEVGNAEKDFFIFDLGSGALANFNSLGLPLESTTKVFLSHLHADHIGDIPGWLGSLAKAGRVDPVEIWGGASEDPAFGLGSFVHHIGRALAWDLKISDTEVIALSWKDGRTLTAVTECDLLVNATSVGMKDSSAEGKSPLSMGLIPKRALVYDVVYNPIETPLLAAAKRAGARTLGGLPMLVYQGRRLRAPDRQAGAD